jgi:hypothetical protein
MSGSTPLRAYSNSSLATNFTLAHLQIAFPCLILAPPIEETEEKEICRQIILKTKTLFDDLRGADFSPPYGWPRRGDDTLNLT